MNGQTIYPDHWDGRLHVKFNESYPVPIFGSQAQFITTQNVFASFDSLMYAHGGVSCRRFSFAFNTPYFERGFELEFANFGSVDDFIADLEGLPYIDYAQKVPIDSIVTYTPNDQGCTNSQSGLANANAFRAFSLHKGENRPIIAVIDDAIWTGHPDIQNNIIPGWDVADNDNNPNPPTTAMDGFFDHGTHCAGIAGADTDNGIGIAAIGFNCKIMPIKGKRDGNMSPGSIDVTYGGLDWAYQNGARIFSCSWGSPQPPTQLQYDLLRAIYNGGGIIVAAVGNENLNAARYPAALGQVPNPNSYSNYMANEPNFIIAVASIDFDGCKSVFSNYGNWVDISAYGNNILSLGVNNNALYTIKSGTSMACPQVAGLVGLMRSYNQAATPAQLMNALRASANVDITTLGCNSTYTSLLGQGRIDALAALVALQPCTITTTDFTIPPTPLNVAVNPSSFTFSNTITGSYSWDINGNRFSGIGTSWQHNFPIGTNVGNYPISLTITNANGCTTTANTCVELTCPANASFTASNTSTMINTNIQLTGPGAQPNVTYNYSIAGNPVGATVSQAGVFNATANGLYRVCLTATNAQYNCSSQHCLLITVGNCSNAARYSNWVVDPGHSYSFSSGGVTQNTLNTSIYNPFEGVSSISDNQGNLLLYTEGISLINGSGTTRFRVRGHASASQASVLLPHPGNANLYYLFTTGAVDEYVPTPNNIPSGLRVFLIELNASNDIVAVTPDDPSTPNIIDGYQLLSNTTEHLTVMKHCNGRDFWVIAHNFDPVNGSNQFVTYPINISSPTSSLGLPSFNTNRVNSNEGPLIRLLARNLNRYHPVSGTLKGSPDGTMLAFTTGCAESIFAMDEYQDERGLHLFEFNASNGSIVWKKRVAELFGAYGSEFSPDMNSLYVTFNNSISQYRFFSTSASVLAASITNPGFVPTSLQLAPDGHVYVKSPSSILRIANPNNNMTPLNLTTVFNQVIARGLPNFPTSEISPPAPNILGNREVCFNSINIYTTCVTQDATYLWAISGNGQIIGSTNGTSVNVRATSTGFYTLTLTRSDPACGITSHEMLVYVRPQLELDLGTNRCGLPTIIGVGSSFGFTYIWNTGENTPSITVNQPGIYRLTITDELGCTASDEIQVGHQAANCQIATSNLGCVATLSLSGSYVSYLWSTQERTSTIQTTSGGLYSVTITDICGFTCSSSTQVVFLPNCCNGQPIPTSWVSLNNATSSQHPNGFPSGTNLFLSGTFTINTGSPTLPYRLGMNVIVHMAPNARIEVLPFKGLYLKNDAFLGCDRLWETILVRGDARLITENCVFKDAERAITLENKSLSKITLSTFESNNIGIQMNQPNATSDIFLTEFACANNVFRNSTPLLAPRLGQRSFAGIVAWRVLNVSIGKDNQFLGAGGTRGWGGLRNGIRANNCGMANVLPCIFKDIQGIGSPNDGCGIFVEGATAVVGSASLVQRGYGEASSTNTFENCHIGIKAIKCNTDIANNRMIGMNYGIDNQLSNNGNTNIAQNAMTCTKAGIKMYQCQPVRAVNINQNNITVNPNIGGAAYGISIDETNISASRTYQVQQCTIVVNEFTGGTSIPGASSSVAIKTNNASGLTIFKNIITLNSPPTVNALSHSGIHLTASSSTNASCNTITGNRGTTGSTTTETPAGIWMADSKGMGIGCNTLTNIRNGIKIDNDCGVSTAGTPTTLNGNTFNTNNYGLMYNRYANTGFQYDKGNQWNGALKRAIHFGNDPLFIRQSEYKVENNNQTNFPAIFTPNAQGTQWFTISLTPLSTYRCAQTQICGMSLLDPNGPALVSNPSDILDQQDVLTAEGIPTNPDFAESQLWKEQVELYEKLDSEPTLIAPNSVFEAFMDDAANTSIEDFYEVKESKDEAAYLQPVDESQLTALYQQIKLANEQIIALEEVLFDSIPDADSTLLAGELESEKMALEALMVQEQQLLTGITTLKENATNLVITENGLLPNTEVFYANEKAVNDIFLHTIAKGNADFTADQILTLENIANQCPLLGGMAVYAARSLYAIIDNKIYDDKSLCMQQGILARQTSQSTEASAKIYPNPSDGNLVLSLSSSLEEDATLSIYNIIGEQLETIILSKGTNQIEFTLDYPTGIYMGTLESNGKIMMTEKISIIK